MSERDRTPAAPAEREPEAAAEEYRLIPLDCPTCGAAVAAEGVDVVFYCTACRNGYRFDLGKGVERVEVAFVALPQVAADLYRPFWLLDAQVTIHQRTASGRRIGGLFDFFLGGREATGSAPGEGTFAVPAFQAPLAVVTKLTRRYTEALPGLGELLGERLVGGRYGEEDARRLAHYALIAAQVDQPDTLKDLRYDIEFGASRLLGVPFLRRGEVLADAVFGIRT